MHMKGTALEQSSCGLLRRHSKMLLQVLKKSTITSVWIVS